MTDDTSQGGKPATDGKGEKGKARLSVIDSAGDAVELANETNKQVRVLLEDGVNDEAILMKIAELEQEHRDLDQALTMLEERLPYDRLTMQRMKKRKLLLKDKIVQLKDKLEPDIIA